MVRKCLVDSSFHCRSGDSSGPFEIFQEHEPKIRSFIMGKVNQGDREDLLSQIRLKFVERLPSLIDETQVKNFLFQITRDELKSYWKSCYRFEASQEFEDVASDHFGNSLGGDGETNYLEKERLHLLRTCLQEIAHTKVRSVAVIRFLEGQAHKVIQERLSLTKDQVKKHIRNAQILITDCVRRKLAQARP